MSCTELVFFGKNGKSLHCAETKNAFRGAMAVWNELSVRHLGKEPSLWDMKPVWELADSPKLSRNEKICLISTFDNVFVKRENFPELVAAFRSFGGSTSLGEQADIIESEIENDECFALAWNQTSVNQNKWTDVDYDDEGEEIAGTEYNLIEKIEENDNLFEDDALK